MPEFAFIQRHDAATFASLLPPHICCILHRSIYYSDIKLVLGCPGPVWTLFAKVEAWKLCAKVPPENKQQAPSMLFVSNKVVDSPTSLPGTSQLSAVVHPRANVQWIPWKLSKRTAAIDERPKRFAPRHDLEMSQSITDQIGANILFGSKPPTWYDSSLFVIYFPTI